MNRIANSMIKSGFASRPVRVDFAMKIAFALLVAAASFTAGKAILAKTQEAPAPQIATSVSSVNPFILPIDWQEKTAIAQSDANCRSVSVDADEGYGVRGKTTRFVCGNAL